MPDDKHPAEVLADALSAESDRENRGVKYSTAKKAAAELRRIPALEAERGVLLSAVEEWRKLAGQQSDRLAKMEAERDQLRAKAESWDEWQSKTEWVQEASSRGELPIGTLGMHRADAMRLLIDQLRAEVARLRADAERLDSGCMMTNERDEFGDEYRCERRGIDLRAAIDAAIRARKDPA